MSLIKMNEPDGKFQPKTVDLDLYTQIDSFKKLDPNKKTTNKVNITFTPLFPGYQNDPNNL